VARLVVLEFDDDEAAERFVDHMGNRMGATALNAASIALAYSDVIRVVAKPTRFCKCKNPQKFVQTKRFGWRVHEACMKPVPQPWSERRGLLQLLFSANELLDSIRSKERTPDA
jgi:hypothetical protein